MAKAKKEAEIIEEVIETVPETSEAPVIEEVVEEVSGDRQARWEKFLSKAKEQNPVKFAFKEANGEFKEIPASFR